MNKLLLALMTMLCISCANNPKNIPATDAACTGTSCPTPKMEVYSPPVVDTVSKDNWQFSLLGEGWSSVESQDDDVAAAFTNDKVGAFVFLWKEKTSQNYGDYVFSTMESLKSTNIKIVSAKQTSHDNMDFVLFSATNPSDTKDTSAWVGIRNGYGYIFGCSTVHDVDAGNAHDVCGHMFNTLQIK